MAERVFASLRLQRLRGPGVESPAPRNATHGGPLVVIASGRLIVDGTIDELVSQRSDVIVRSTDSARLMPLLVGAGATVVDEGQTGVAVAGLATDEVGRIAFDAGIAIFELTERRASLEETFMQLTGDGQQFAFGE